MTRLPRLLGLLTRVAIATLGGTVVRAIRRVAGRKPRIWHGFHPIHSMRDLVEVDRHLGHPTRSFVYSSRQVGYALVSDDEFDVVLDSSGVPWNERHWAALADIVWRADIWVTNFDCLFFVWHDRRNDWALRLIRLAGIRIVVAPHGSDIVQFSEHRDRYGWVERMSRDYPRWDFSEQTIVSRARVAIFSRFAHFIISGDHTLDPFLLRRDLIFKYFPIDTRKLAVASKPPSSVPTIVHAPNHRYVKGSYELLAAIENLKAKGIPCELRLIERVARPEALRLYADSDIVADQFIIGSFGSLALEGMALGKPVLTYLDRAHLQDPVFNLPVVNTTLENLTEVLAALVQSPELRRRLGAEGRSAVESFQSVEALAEVWGRVYGHVWRGEPLELEKTRHFHPSRKGRSLVEDPSRAEFWPVPVHDLLPEIHAALARVR